MKRESLGPVTVAMALVPGLYSRNKLFSLFRDPVVVHARSRARLIRSAVRHLTSGAEGLVVERGEPTIVRYEVERLHMSRRLELSPLEVACLSFLVTRAGIPGFAPSDEERALLDAALATLPVGHGVSGLSVEGS